MLEIKNLHAIVEGEDIEILKGVNLTVNKGEIHAIMGPNGSGKSTLSKIVAGHPGYEVTEGDIIYDGESILEMDPDERAHAGIFLAFQYPVEVPGVTNMTLLRESYNTIAKSRGREEMDPLEFEDYLKTKLDLVEMNPEFLHRSVNTAFSGGEKKRNEIFQMAVLQPKLSFLDETDSGLDIDALRIVSGGINQIHGDEDAVVMVTHYQRLLEYIVPDVVHVMIDGVIVKTGGKELALELEEKGYDWLETLETTDMHFKELEFTSQPPIDWVAPYAAKAAHSLETLSFPTKKDEDWRFTPLKTLTKHSFQSVNGEAKSVTDEHVQKYRLPESSESTLVLVNGAIREDLSSFSLDSSAITVKKLQEMTPSELEEAGFQSLVPVENDYFSVLHTATLTSGYYLHVHKGAKVEAPIHVLNIQTGGPTPYVSSFRLLIHVEQEAEATLIEEHVSLDDSVYLTIPVMETFVQKKGRLNHLRIQRENKSCFHISRPITSLEGTAEYHSYTIALGAHLFRNEPQIIQTGEEVDFTLDGLILIDGDQISDTHSVMDHRFSHGNSHQLHKVVVHGNAHSVFNGKIFVRQDAQIIDSFQENRNLLLSRDGIVYTKPQLEIFADDVQCSHGATIGDLDPDEVFYLQSRGMTEQKAKEVLTYAFALETIENIEVESVHTFLVDEVKAYTSRNVASRF